MGFWDRIGGAAKWVTDPKQILTAAGFAFGGPVGAGVGRAVGGMVPQSAGPVPWGALGADTGGFRKSTLADGLQWRDVGQAGKDFVSGYSAGRVGQQIPGIKDLEGAFAQGGMFRGGPGMMEGANLSQLGPGQIPGQSLINAQPMPGMPALHAQQPTIPNLSQLGPDQIPGQSLINAQPMPGMPAQAPGSFQPGTPGPLPFELSSNVGARLPQAPQAIQAGTPDFGPVFRSPGHVGGPVNLGVDLPMGGYYGPSGYPAPAQNIPGRSGSLAQASAQGAGRGWGGPYEWGIEGQEAWHPPAPLDQLEPDRIPGQSVINRQINMPETPGEDPMWKRGVDAAGKWFGELSPMEKIYLSTQAPQILSSMTGGGGHTIGREGTALLGEMGMFSPASRYRAPRFDQWRSS